MVKRRQIPEPHPKDSGRGAPGLAVSHGDTERAPVSGRLSSSLRSSERPLETPRPWSPPRKALEAPRSRDD